MIHDDNAGNPNEEQESNAGEDQETKSNKSHFGKVSSENPGLFFEIIGLLFIIYGILGGYNIFFRTMDASANLFGQTADHLNTFLIALGCALIFIGPGVICFGISKILNALKK